ncbi:ORF6N domain-containing protein [Citrobacter portucalensis]|uniref:ORF6N domain-containing protein n=1 Tax=Citrobacter portucalensis TaxID=1639133 RepID=UPI00226BAF67|nr:ORF6N domain-containing protein [Citrobacter portucalensis]MCX8984814.1 ORF6N domain-containing protein [Citrobacter portucalensis]
MTTQVSAESLSVISHANIPVITTELLAQLYGTETNNIKVNFTRNADRFVCGKHYFKLEGHELREFKHKVTQSNLVASRAKHLILWTERGAARHAKMLETDQAWNVFEKLEDCYFSHKTDITPPVPTYPQTSPDPANRTEIIYYKDYKPLFCRVLRADEVVINPEAMVEYMKMQGLVFFTRGELESLSLGQFLAAMR